MLDYLRKTTPPGEPDAVLAAMDRFAREQRFLMNIGDVKGQILRRALTSSGARDVLELGTYCGYSAILIAQQLPAGGHLDSLEVNLEYATTAREIIAHAGMADRVTVHHGTAADVIPAMKKSYELVFIDHWKNQYLPDLLLIEEADLIHPGSYVVADNIGMFDATGYLDHVRDCGRYENTNHEAHMEYNDTVFDAVEVSILKH